ncbi:MAG: CpsB/CapC family capsule biosynthesis tyrosine phosphatase [Bryobacteraceae bacterium]
MIDIHSHVLFGVDDGARTIEDSLAMLRMAAEHGTTDIVATPHASPSYKFDPECNRDRLAQLEEQAGGVLRLHTGCDFHLSFDNIQDAIEHPSKYTIDHKNYLMVEFSDMLVFHNTAEIFGRLMDAGMIPVITHPERNPLLRQRIDTMAEWIAEGARVQVTAQSLTGRFGKRAEAFSRRLLDRGMVHVIASDGHDIEHRPPCMDTAFEWLKANYSEETATLLCVTNPGAALASEPMQSATVSKPRSGKRSWFKFWQR